MRNTMLIKPELLVKDMMLIMPDGTAQRVEHVEREAEGYRYCVRLVASKTEPSRWIIRHSHEYARISSRIPAHARGAVLAKAGVTGEFLYTQKLEDKPVRHWFVWIPMTAKRRHFGLGSDYLTQHGLKRMSDFVLTGGVPQG